MTSTLIPHDFFKTTVYIADKPEFLSAVRVVADEYLKDIKSKNKQDMLYPTQTEGFAHEPILAEFTQFVVQAAWNILDSQGYAMNTLQTTIREMWCQEHQQYQGHDEHVHSHGDQISGVYLLDVPQTGSKLAIHDPRVGKNQINLPEKDIGQITLASETAILLGDPGRFYFFNSWLPHSITRNTGTTPTKLIHFNIGVIPAKENTEEKAIIV